MSELTQADLKKLLPAEPVQPVEAHEGPVHVLRDSARGIGILISNAPLITAAAFIAMMPFSAWVAANFNLDPGIEVMSYAFPPFAAAVMIGGWWSERRKLSRFYFDVKKRQLTLGGPAHGGPAVFPLDDVIALQVIPAGDRAFFGAGTHAYTVDVYELNAVIRCESGDEQAGETPIERRNLACHGNAKLICDDAQAIADRTGVPLVVSPKVPRNQIEVTPR